jgi:hypothetical protein
VRILDTFLLIAADVEQSTVNSQVFHAFFMQDLFLQYQKATALDAKNNEVGYLDDFNHFTGARENSAGFWIGKVAIIVLVGGMKVLFVKACSKSEFLIPGPNGIAGHYSGSAKIERTVSNVIISVIGCKGDATKPLDK